MARIFRRFATGSGAIINERAIAHGPLAARHLTFVWAYALAWLLVSDRVKVLAYRIFDPTTAKASYGLTALVARPA